MLKPPSISAAATIANPALSRVRRNVLLEALDDICGDVGSTVDPIARIHHQQEVLVLGDRFDRFGRIVDDRLDDFLLLVVELAVERADDLLALIAALTG